jgi:hypothetical protein
VPEIEPTEAYKMAKEAFQIGYSMGEQLGLDEVGTRLGGSIYDFVHPDTIEAVRDMYREQMPDIDFVTVPGSEVGLPDFDYVKIPLH